MKKTTITMTKQLIVNSSFYSMRSKSEGYPLHYLHHLILTTLVAATGVAVAKVVVVEGTHAESSKACTHPKYTYDPSG